MRKIKKLCAVLVTALIMTTVFPEPIALTMNLQTVEAAAIKMSKSKASLNIGKSLSLKVVGTAKKPKWKSNNKAVASVTSSGKVTAHKKGSATITAQIGAKTYICNITVKEQNTTCIPSKKATFTGVEAFIDTKPFFDYTKVTINSFSARLTNYSTYINYSKPININSDYFYPYKYLIKINGRTNKKLAGKYISISFATKENGVLQIPEMLEVSTKIKTDGTFSLSQTMNTPNYIDSFYIYDMYVDGIDS